MAAAETSGPGTAAADQRETTCQLQPGLFATATGSEAMAKDILGEAGLHFDELNKLRMLEPEVTQTIELKEGLCGQNSPISENT